MIVNDEILNKYLDGELSSSEMSEIRSAINSSDDIRKKHEALKLVHSELKRTKAESPSALFTNKVMQKIQRRFSVSKNQRYFITAISSFIILACLGLVAYLSVMIISTYSASGINLPTDTANSISTYLTSLIKSIFAGKNLSIIGSIFSLGIIISAYWFFEQQKRARSNLHNHA